MVLNIHGEVPSDPSKDVSVLNAESKFLPTLLDIHRRFPKLRIVLEHCTTADAVEAVRACGPTVAGTITAHHLSLVIDHAVSDVFCFCKPVAKSPEDRRALLQAVVSSEGKFFLGTDSARKYTCPRCTRSETDNAQLMTLAPRRARVPQLLVSLRSPLRASTSSRRWRRVLSGEISRMRRSLRSCSVGS